MKEFCHWFEYTYNDKSGDRQLKLPKDLKLRILNNFKTLKQFIDDYDPAYNISNRDIFEIWKKHSVLSIKFIVDRGISHELVRHRCSVAQSSTRYCNYSKAKFGNCITYVQPSTYDDWSAETKQKFEDHLENCESLYMYMINSGLQPQQARAILPNALMTEVVLTMPINQWNHFFNIRALGTTGAPHPDMKKVALIAKALFDEYVAKSIDHIN